MRDDMVFAVCISYIEYQCDDNFICKKLSDVDSFIKEQLNGNNDRNIRSIVIDVVDFYDPAV